MSEDVRKLVALGLAFAGAATALVLGVPKLLGSAAGADVEVVTALKLTERAGFESDVLGRPLRSTRVSYQRISVVPQGDRATVTATLDFDGEYGATKVSSLGHERVPFVLRDGEWEPAEGWAPQLQRVVAALERRRAALERGEAQGMCDAPDGGEPDSPELKRLFEVRHRKVRATAWLVRSERDGVMVSEDFRVTGDLPDRPVDDSGTRRLQLIANPVGEFCFPAGLM